MRDFRSNNRFGGRGGRPTLHQTVCDNCGKPCEVPFQPTGEKPVYCNECFAAQGGHERNTRPSFGGRRFPSREGGRSPFRHEGAGKDYGKEIAAINTKLDKIMVAMGLTEAKQNLESPELLAPTPETLPVDDESPMADDLIATDK